MSTAPSTDEIKKLATDWVDMGGEVDGPAFDRWLADHDERVRTEERERCAQIAEGGLDPAFDRELGAPWQRSKIAAAIRAVSEQEDHQ